MNYDLNAFITWQQDAPTTRIVNIEIGRFANPFDNADLIKIWVYDISLDVGQHVRSVEEIDLEAERKKKDLRKLQELKERYGDEV